MGTALLLARLGLAAVFVVSGAAKLFDRSGSRQAVIDFGLPSALATPLGLLVPVAELAVAAALVPATTARLGALGALVLLVAFSVAIAINLARGRAPECHCFGQIHSSPVGWPILGRNALLAAVAGFVLWRGWDDAGPSIPAVLGPLSGDELGALLAGLTLLGLLLIEGALIANLLRQNGRLLIRLDALEARLDGDGGKQGTDIPQAGLAIGSQAPGFSLPGLRGETLTLDFLRAAGKPVLLVFAHPGCGPCEGLLPELEAWHQEHGAELTLAVLSEGGLDSNRATFVERRLPFVVIQEVREVAEAYEVSGTPSAVVVSPDGTVGSHLAAGAPQVRTLVESALGQAPAQPPAQPDPAPEAAVPQQPAPTGNGSGNEAGAVAQAVPLVAQRGQRAPALTLPDLSGRPLNLADLKGSSTLLVFWNPGCGFCSQMLPDFKAWEANKPKSAPKIVVVSTGDKTANVALGLRSRVLLDGNFAAATAFGANGTPMAVLLDSKGIVASEVAGGAPAVMALARGETEPTGG
jgi:thiol-disulfide isomerase/thioredoxin